MLNAIPYWVHLLTAAIWIGSQVMMLAVVMPAVRTVDDPLLRQGLIRAMTRYLGYLGWGALVLLLLTGLIALADKNSEYQPTGVFDYGFRYAWLLTAKLILVAAVIALTAWHTFKHGPRLLDLHRAAAEPNAPAELQWRLKAMRQTSVLISVASLALVLIIFYLVTLMQNFDFAFGEA